MSDWQDEIEVITTYGSIERAKAESFRAGEGSERERIIKLLESFDPRIAIGDILPLLIKGDDK